jgi:uncharacterized cysteine cluster protein YcgN (CxxCxxCC family)
VETRGVWEDCGARMKVETDGCGVCCRLRAVQGDEQKRLMQKMRGCAVQGERQNRSEIESKTVDLISKRGGWQEAMTQTVMWRWVV